MNILRRIRLSRLLLLCGLVVAVGVSATAIASAVGSGPAPAPKPLADAIHDALTAPSVQGVSASVTLTDHLLEGASLAGGGHSGELTSSPLITGASGRLWIAKDGRVRLELQSEGGDTQILYDGHTLSLYDAATNTLYRYVPPAQQAGASSSTPGQLGVATPEVTSARASHTEVTSAGASEIDVALPDTQAQHHEVPTVAKIEEAISHLGKHANVSGATPSDVAGQPAYTVRVSPQEGGSLFGGVELSFDAVQGVPLRAAIYSSTSASPVIELAATEVSYGPVADSVFDINPPANAKIEEVKAPGSSSAHASGDSAPGADKPNITTDGHGPSAIAVLESKTKTGAATSSQEPLEGLPKVTINGTSASELRTELGTLLSFERGGVRYLLAGSVPPAAIEALARGL